MSTTSIEEAASAEEALAPIADAPVAAPAAPQPAADVPLAPVAPAHAADPDVTTFRGRTLEELLPQIRGQLGPDAIVVRQRDGLVGGIGGFFQQRFVEVDARAGAPRVDVYDEEPEPFAALLAAAEIETGPAAEAVRISPRMPRPDLPSSEEPPAPAPGAAPIDAGPAEPVPVGAQTALAPALIAELTAAGMSHAFGARLVGDAEAHELPFAPDLRSAVRRALARRIPTAIPHRAGGLAVAFAGPGSTACASALAAAYKRAGRDARAVATLDQARARIERGAPDQLLVLDLPPVAAERAEAAALAERVHRLHLDEVLTVLPADLDLLSARALHERLSPLAPTGVALACEPGARLGAALELACTTRLPLAYVFDGAAIAPADPATLAEHLLP